MQGAARFPPCTVNPYMGLEYHTDPNIPILLGPDYSDKSRGAQSEPLLCCVYLLPRGSKYPKKKYLGFIVSIVQNWGKDITISYLDP